MFVLRRAVAFSTATITTSLRAAATAAATTIGIRRSISVGSKIPSSIKVKEVIGDTINETTTDDFFKGKKIILVGVPAAFSPTCSEKHIPQFLEALPLTKKKGVDKVAILAVNDFFTCKAWAKAQGVGDKLSFLADGNGELTKALGDVELDLSKALLGVRSKRFSAVVEDGVVKTANIEPDGTGYSVSSAENTLKQL